MNAASAHVPPRAALYGDAPALPALPPCVHRAGTEKFLAKARALQAERGPVFDIAGDCEDGGPVGLEDEKLHDRASYRHCWSVLSRAHAAGVPLPAATAPFFASGS